MSLTQVLSQEAEAKYDVAGKLFRRVTDADLAWKPPSGRNWMSMGQLLRHCSDACGAPIRGFVTDDWGMPDGARFEDLPPEQQLPPAEALPCVGSVAEALTLLMADRELARRYICEAGEVDLLGRCFPAPWGGPTLTLFQHLLHMIDHLGQHKGQLFYYLKWMGRDLATPDLWGA
jgi:uncharacterized damage-inducible protein DinB